MVRFQTSALGAAFIALSIPAHAAWSLADGAAVHPQYQGAVPAKSDVIFSTRFKRADAAASARAFGATRIEWVYSADKSFVDDLTKVAPWFGGTINANGPLPTDEGMARDFDGKVIVVPWMTGWNGRWITTTNPQTQQVLAAQVTDFIAVGAKSIQVDDPILQLHPALFQGGDFNDSTLAGFPKFLAKYSSKAMLASAGLADFKGSYKDYLVSRYGVKDNADYVKRFRTFPSTRIWLEYIKSTVEAHYANLRGMLKSPDRTLSLSMNLTTLTEPNEQHRLFFLTRFADYAIAETYIKDYGQVTSQVATLRSLGVGFAPSIQPLGTADNRVAIASLYAMGAVPVVPWDTYTGNDSSGKASRYFGRPEDYVDIYKFAREHAEALDELETAAVVGIVVPVNRYSSKVVGALVSQLASGNIPFAFVPVSGQFRAFRTSAEKLRGYKQLILTNAMSDYDPDTQALIEKTNTPKMPIGVVDNAALQRLQPFVIAPGAATVRIYPRARPGRRDEIILHVVDSQRGEVASASSECVRRIGVRRLFVDGMKISSATWTSRSGARSLPVEQAGDIAYFTVNECALWGMVRLVLKE